jgi:large subunit ribosomal protein L4
LVLDAPEFLAAPTKPQLPAKPRGAKKRAAFAEVMKKYSSELNQYKEDQKTYMDSLDDHMDKVEKGYENIVLSSRNLKKASVADAKTLNVYQILNANCLVVSESAVNRLSEMLS